MNTTTSSRGLRGNPGFRPRGRTTALWLAVGSLTASGPAAHAEPEGGARTLAVEQRVMEIDAAMDELRELTNKPRFQAAVVARRSYTLLEEALRVAETGADMNQRAREFWNAICHHAIALARDDETLSSDVWLTIYERLVDLTPETAGPDGEGRAARDAERDRIRHETLCRTALAMLLDRLPQEYAAGELERAREAMIGEPDKTALETWLYDLLIYAPPAAKGDALLPQPGPLLGGAVSQTLSELVADERINPVSRAHLVTAMATARHSSGQSAAAARLIDAWWERFPELKSTDPVMLWLRFNIALFGKGDRQEAGEWLRALQLLAGEEGAAPAVGGLVATASRHYFDLLLIYEDDYRRLIRDQEDAYLDRRRRDLNAWFAGIREPSPHAPWAGGSEERFQGLFVFWHYHMNQRIGIYAAGNATPDSVNRRFHGSYHDSTGRMFRAGRVREALIDSRQPLPDGEERPGFRHTILSRFDPTTHQHGGYMRPEDLAQGASGTPSVRFLLVNEATGF